MGDETLGVVKSQLPFEESEKQRLILLGQLRETQYADEQFRTQGWNSTQGWIELIRQKADLEQERFDLIHCITHRVDLEGDKSPAPRKGQSQGGNFHTLRNPTRTGGRNRSLRKRIPEPGPNTYVSARLKRRSRTPRRSRPFRRSHNAPEDGAPRVVHLRNARDLTKIELSARGARKGNGLNSVALGHGVHTQWLTTNEWSVK